MFLTVTRRNVAWHQLPHLLSAQPCACFPRVAKGTACADCAKEMEDAVLKVVEKHRKRKTDRAIKDSQPKKEKEQKRQKK